MHRIAFLALIATTVLAGCGGNAAAQDAAETCEDDYLHVDGSAVRFEVTGEDAAALGSAADSVSSGDTDAAADIIPAFAALVVLDCMVEATGYPGTSDDLADGDEWEGWRYEEGETVGSEIRFAFIAD